MIIAEGILQYYSTTTGTETPVESSVPISAASLREQIRDAYIEFLGPLGVNQFLALGQGLNRNDISTQINALVRKGILTAQEQREFLAKITALLNTPSSSPMNRTKPAAARTSPGRTA
jgi:hypothetical protein